MTAEEARLMRKTSALRAYHSWLVGTLLFVISAPISGVWIAGRMKELYLTTMETDPSMHLIGWGTGVPMAVFAIILFLCTANAGDQAGKYNPS